MCAGQLRGGGGGRGGGIVLESAAMSKAERVAHLCAEDGSGWDPHYAGWFACFNRGAYYEAHDVLEALWLRSRATPDAAYYKGLIQLAGAFVHLQKGRLGPAVALFRLADANLAGYGASHLGVDLGAVLGLIGSWRSAAEAGGGQNPLGTRAAPEVRLERRAGPG